MGTNFLSWNLLLICDYFTCWLLPSCREQATHATKQVSLEDQTEIKILFFFKLYHMAFRILVLQPGIERRPLQQKKAPSPNHRIAREVTKIIMQIIY